MAGSARQKSSASLQKQKPKTKESPVDPHYQRLELDRICHVLENMKHDRILHIGGSRELTNPIAKKFPDAEVEAYDGSVLSLSRSSELLEDFDVILSTGALTALANWDEQLIALLEMRKVLADNGHIVMVEGFKEGLVNLNAIRKKLNLSEIKPDFHESYIPQTELIKTIQKKVFRLEFTENIGNFYYLVDSVINAKMRDDKAIKEDYSSKINAISSEMPTLGEFYACSPMFMVILRNGENS